MNDEPTLASVILLWIVAIFGFFMFLAGLAVFGLQVFGWLKGGEWTGISLLILVSIIFPEHDAWVASPQDWIGLHKVLSKIPLALFLVVCGFWITLASSGAAGEAMDIVREKRRAKG